MSDANTLELVMPRVVASSVRGRRGVNLWLPESPSFGFDSDFEVEFTGSDFPSPPLSADSAGNILVSHFSDDSSEGFNPADIAYPSEDGDIPTGTAAQVTVEGDGSQLIHIPFASPFYLQPTPTRSFSLRPPPRNTPVQYTPFSPSFSSPSSSSSGSASMLSSTPRDSQTPLLILSTAPSPQDEAPSRDKRPIGAMLFVDTFLSAPSSSTNMVFPTLSASCYFSDGMGSGRTSVYSPWGSDSDYDGDLDVPQSAITPMSPLDFWDQSPTDFLGRNEGVGACS